MWSHLSSVSLRMLVEIILISGRKSQSRDVILVHHMPLFLFR